MRAWREPRPDTRVIKARAGNSATYVAEWVAKQIGHPAVGSHSDCREALCPKTLGLAKIQFKERLDSKKCAAKLGNDLWKLSAAFAYHGVPGPVIMDDTSVVKVLEDREPNDKERSDLIGEVLRRARESCQLFNLSDTLLRATLQADQKALQRGRRERRPRSPSTVGYMRCLSD
jgi:hypothetical protein